jgi:hypothetical protein
VDNHKTGSSRFFVEPINGVEKTDAWTERWVTYGWRLMAGLPGKLVAEYRKSDGYSDPEAAARHGMEDARQRAAAIADGTIEIIDGAIVDHRDDDRLMIDVDNDEPTKPFTAEEIAAIARNAR